MLTVRRLREILTEIGAPEEARLEAGEIDVEWETDDGSGPQATWVAIDTESGEIIDRHQDDDDDEEDDDEDDDSDEDEEPERVHPRPLFDPWLVRAAWWVCQGPLTRSWWPTLPWRLLGWARFRLGWTRILHVQLAFYHGTPDGTPERPYPTIRAALAAAWPADTVFVEPGVYAEICPLRVVHGVNLTLKDSTLSPAPGTYPEALIDMSGHGEVQITGCTLIQRSPPGTEEDEQSRCILKARWFGRKP
jgi:hypothetical protein